MNASSMNQQHKGQSIRRWSVTGNDRIVGAVYGRPGQADGATIITSPIVQVRRVGPHRSPVAVTQSGSAYWLEDPAPAFGMDRAEAFILARDVAAPVAAPAAAGSMMRTGTFRMEPAPELTLEEIR